MQSRKQILESTMKQLSAKERKEAMKWIDSLPEQEIQRLELLNKIQLVEILAERFLSKGARGLNKKSKRNK